MNTNDAVTTDAAPTDAADARPALAFPTAPAFDRAPHANAVDGSGNPDPTRSYTWQWRDADRTVERTVDGVKTTVAEYPVGSDLYNARGWVAVVRPVDGDTVAVALENARSLARVRHAYESGADVEFVPVAHKSEFAPPAAPRTKKTVVVSLSDADRAALVAAYAVADDAGKTALAAGFPFLADADA